jgi:hypothetical protein
MLAPYFIAPKKYFTFPPFEDSACGEADKNKFLSTCCIKGFFVISGGETLVKTLKHLAKTPLSKANLLVNTVDTNRLIV